MFTVIAFVSLLFLLRLSFLLSKVTIHFIGFQQWASTFLVSILVKPMNFIDIIY
jgi:hypothetical protein